MQGPLEWTRDSLVTCSSWTNDGNFASNVDLTQFFRIEQVAQSCTRFRFERFCAIMKAGRQANNYFRSDL
jgi:hypothetical protein